MVLNFGKRQAAQCRAQGQWLLPSHASQSAGKCA